MVDAKRRRFTPDFLQDAEMFLSAFCNKAYASDDAVSLFAATGKKKTEYLPE